MPENRSITFLLVNDGVSRLVWIAVGFTSTLLLGYRHYTQSFKLSALVLAEFAEIRPLNGAKLGGTDEFGQREADDATARSQGIFTNKDIGPSTVRVSPN